MKSKILLPILDSAEIMVSQGQQISPGTVIQKTPSQSQEESVPISTILKLAPDRIVKYLTINTGDKITKGDIIAQKKGIFSTRLVKSPLTGKIVLIDLKKGTLVISGQSQNKNIEITCPIAAKVKNISKNEIELEVEAKILTGLGGEGKDVLGILKYVSCGHLGILDVDFDADQSIVACGCIYEEVLVKLEVLGTLGIIGCKIPKENRIAYIRVEESVLDQLSKYDGQNIWMRPFQKEIIIYN